MFLRWLPPTTAPSPLSASWQPIQIEVNRSTLGYLEKCYCVACRPWKWGRTLFYGFNCTVYICIGCSELARDPLRQALVGLHIPAEGAHALVWCVHWRGFIAAVFVIPVLKFETYSACISKVDVVAMDCRFGCTSSVLTDSE